MTESREELLRDLVAWVEYNDQLPDIDREWNQNLWLDASENRAEELADAYAEDMVVKEFGGDFTPWLASDKDRAAYEAARDAYFNSAMDRIQPRCGSAYCAAGYIARKVDPRYAKDEVVDGVHSATVAAEALGLEVPDLLYTRHPAQECELFSADNTAADIREMAEELVGHEL